MLTLFTVSVRAESLFAQIDAQGNVLRVIVAEQSVIDSGLFGLPSSWIKTEAENGVRKNFAGQGYKYDQNRNAFLSPRPFPSWQLDENTAQWQPPVPMPPGAADRFEWDEEGQRWIPRPPAGPPAGGNGR